MTKRDYIKIISAKTEVPQYEVETILNEAYEIIRQTLKNKDIVKISGFGTFFAKQRSAREGYDPRNGEKLKIAEKVFVRFKASKNFKI